MSKFTKQTFRAKNPTTMTSMNSNSNNSIAADSDPAAVLQYDSAAVAINATGNSKMLDSLNKFAGSVKHYSQLMKQNAIAPNGEGDITDLVPAASTFQRNTSNLLSNNNNNNNNYLHNNNDDFVDPATLLQYDPAGLAMRTKGNSKMLNDLINFSASLTYYVGMVQEREASVFLKIEEESDDENDREEFEGTTTHDLCNKPCFLAWTFVKRIKQ